MLFFSLSATWLLVGCGNDQSAPTPQVAPDSEKAVTVQRQEGDEIVLPPPSTATMATKAANEAIAERLDLADEADFENASRGLLAQIEGDAIKGKNGHIVWPIKQLDFTAGEAPASVNPSLWRQAQLLSRHGLFEVMEGIYQVRGYDLANMTLIEGETGWIIVDPLTNVETAEAALKLANETLGARPVTGVIYTHSHADHFGGARGVITEEEVAVRNIPVLAPIGFSESAVSENLHAGNHMGRRATLMFGGALARDTHGHVSSGLGPGLPQGTVSLVPPTEEIDGKPTQRRIDGVLFEFIDAAGTEAPAEFMFYLPEKRALCTAEVATGTLHNVLTPRGAQARDALKWSQSIDGVLKAYGDKSDVVFASHHWPNWGSENVTNFLRGQRDIYRYIHDQTLRHANAGATAFETAEAIAEPDIQAEAFNTRGYYGTINHNSKAVYQYYFGWWSGNPAEYYAHPKSVTARRYIDQMGGDDEVLGVAKQAFAAGDYRWSAELLNHLVFANPENTMAKDWLAATYDQLGFQSESGAWRSYFLVAAHELRHGTPDIGNPNQANPEFLKAIPSRHLFDALAVRFAPEKMTREPYALVFNFTDREETLSILVGKSVIVPREGAVDDAAASVTMTRADFDLLVAQEIGAPRLVLSGRMKIEGSRQALSDMFDALDMPEFWFNIVEP